MHRSFPATALLFLTLAGCHSTPATQQLSYAELESRYNAAFKKYQDACFHPESAGAISDAFHGPTGTRKTAPATTLDPVACKAAKAEADSYEEPMRAALNAQRSH